MEALNYNNVLLRAFGEDHENNGFTYGTMTIGGL